METILSINLIVSNPDVRNGCPVIAGTGIRVSDIAAASLFQRQSPDEIAVGFGLSLGQVYAAFAYYYEHKAEIDAEIKEEDRRLVEAKARRIGQRRDSFLP